MKISWLILQILIALSKTQRVKGECLGLMERSNVRKAQATWGEDFVPGAIETGRSLRWEETTADFSSQMINFCLVRIKLAKQREKNNFPNSARDLVLDQGGIVRW